MQDFPANSNMAKETAKPREKLKPVTTAEAVRRKRGLGRQFKDTFIGGDARSASEYVFLSVVVPEIRDLVYNAAHGFLERMVFGDSAKPRHSGVPMGGYSGLGHTNYAGASKASAAMAPPQRTLSRRSRARHSLNELVIASRQEAEEVIEQMFEVLSRYGMVSVADLYELTGVQSSHTDMKWGWTSLRGAKAVRLRQGGFVLQLPDPEPFG